MKRFRKLAVYGEPQELEQLIAITEALMNDRWFRDEEREVKMERLLHKRIFCFVLRAITIRPEVVVVLILEGRRLWVENLHAEGQELSADEYNMHLIEFFLWYLHPAALATGVITELSSDEPVGTATTIAPRIILR